MRSILRKITRHDAGRLGLAYTSAKCKRPEWTPTELPIFDVFATIGRDMNRAQDDIDNWRHLVIGFDIRLHAIEKKLGIGENE